MPLLVPLPAIARLRHRGLIWGSFLAIFYFMVGAMEAWASPPRRLAAGIQIVLAAGYLAGVIAISRRRNRPGARHG
jgi:uncharacterized membrane protein